MVTPEEKLSQADRISGISMEIVKLVVEGTRNRSEASAAIRSALEVVAAFPRPISDCVEDNA